MEYACGINLTSKKWNDQSWTGQNLTGRSLVEVRDRLRLNDSTEGCNTNLCDASSTSGSASSSDAGSEYRIFNRKSKAHMHSTAMIGSMVRRTRPTQPTQRPRPRPPADCNITGRSQPRGSNMHDQSFPVGETSMEEESGNEPCNESSTGDNRVSVGTTTTVCV